MQPSREEAKNPLKLFQGIVTVTGIMTLGVGIGLISDLAETNALLFFLIGMICMVISYKWDHIKENLKAKKLRKDDAAVSPVIAVILMVAITVVLAATVFVLVTGIGDDVREAPQMSWRADSDEGVLTLIQAPSGLNWTSFTITGCANQPTGTVDAGDTITGCTGRIIIRHNPSNSLVYEAEF